MTTEQAAVVAAMNEPRYIVSSVTGFHIVPSATGVAGQTSRTPPASYYVLDRAYCHREVASFNAGGRGIRDSFNGTNERRRRLAEAEAAELNAWDAEVHGA